VPAKKAETSAWLRSVVAVETPALYRRQLAEESSKRGRVRVLAEVSGSRPIDVGHAIWRPDFPFHVVEEFVNAATRLDLILRPQPEYRVLEEAEEQKGTPQWVRAAIQSK
jgi:hypothetical protein